MPLKRALFIAGALILLAAAVFISYLAFRGHDTELEYADLTIVDKSFENGEFSARFLVKKTGFYICGFETETDGENLYITLKANIDSARALERDEEKHVVIRLDAEEGIKTVYYRQGGKQNKLAEAK